MRISSSLLFFFFVIIIVNFQFVLSSDDPTTTTFKDSNELVVDSPDVEEIEENGVKLVSPGIVELAPLVADDNLDVHVDLPKFDGKVCSSKPELTVANLCEPNLYGLQLENDKNRIKLTNQSVSKTDVESCSPSITIHYPEATTFCDKGDSSCNPALNKDTVITIDVRDVSSSSQIRIRNAKIYIPAVTTTTNSSSSSILSSSTEASTSNESIIWIVIVVVSVMVIVIIIIVVVVVIYYKKELGLNQDLEEDVISNPIKEEEEAATNELKENAKTNPENEEVKPPNVEEAAKKFGDLHPNVTKEDPKMVQDEIKPPTSLPKKEPIDVTEEPPQPSLPAHITESKVSIVEYEALKKFKQQLQETPWEHLFRMASRSSESSCRGRFKDSVESQRSINKKRAYEVHYKSMERCGLIVKKLVDSLAKDYKPDLKKKPLNVEISLLCNFIGDVFIVINQLVAKAIEQLKEHDLKLNKDGRAIKMSKTTRKYLQQRNTPEYIRFSCFALEFGHFIPVDEEHLQKYSMALLLVVGFSLNHSDEFRRHALAILRRELLFWRRNSTIEERNAFGYPANAIEAAYEMNPDYFNNNVKRVHTNSTPNNSEEKRSNSKSNGPSKEAAATESKEVIIEKPSMKKNKRK